MTDALAEALDPLDPFALPGEAPRTPRAPNARKPRPRRTRAARATHLGIRMLPSERLRLTGAARRAGYPDVSSWCRGTLLAACDGESLPVLDAGALAEVARLRRDLNAGVGSNLNQVTAHANALAKGGQSPDEGALLAAVEGAKAVLEAVRADLGRLLGPHGRVMGGEFRERRAGGRPRRAGKAERGGVEAGG